MSKLAGRYFLAETMKFSIKKLFLVFKKHEHKYSQKPNEIRKRRKEKEI
jgi:hypothetical protein